MDVTDEATQVRNLHTHETFLSLGLLTDQGIYDPVDVLTIDVPTQARLRRQLEVDLRKEARRIGREYERKARRALDATMALLKATRGVAAHPASGGPAGLSRASTPAG
jgi:hypothetical protein